MSPYIRSIPESDRLLPNIANLVLHIWPIIIVCSRVVERNWNRFTTKWKESPLNIFFQFRHPVNLNSSLTERPKFSSYSLLHIGEILQYSSRYDGSMQILQNQDKVCRPTGYRTTKRQNESSIYFGSTATLTTVFVLWRDQSFLWNEFWAPSPPPCLPLMKWRDLKTSQSSCPPHPVLHSFLHHDS